MISQETIKRRAYLGVKLIDKGISVNDAKNFTLSEWNKNFNANIKTQTSLLGQKRLLIQIKNNPITTNKGITKIRHITNPKVIDFNKKELTRLSTIKAKVKKKVKKPKVKKLKTGQYNITKVIDGYGNDKFIVWSNRAEWIKRLAKIKRDYGIIEVKGTKVHSYEPFETPKAKALRLKLGIKLIK